MQEKNCRKVPSLTHLIIDLIHTKRCFWRLQNMPTVELKRKLSWGGL